jgi:hypothetical protein
VKKMRNNCTWTYKMEREYKYYVLYLSFGYILHAENIRASYK